LGDPINDNDAVTIKDQAFNQLMTFDSAAAASAPNILAGQSGSTNNSIVALVKPATMGLQCCNLTTGVTNPLCPAANSSFCYATMVGGPNQFCTPAEVLAEGQGQRAPLCINYCRFLSGSGNTSGTNCDFIRSVCTDPNNWNNPVCGCARPVPQGYPVLSTIAQYSNTPNIAVPVGCIADCGNDSMAIRPSDVHDCTEQIQICLAGVNSNVVSQVQGNLTSKNSVTNNCNQSSINTLNPTGGPAPGTPGTPGAPGTVARPSFFARNIWLIIGGIVLLLIIIIIVVVVIVFATRH
jgi:hypothetical protein